MAGHHHHHVDPEAGDARVLWAIVVNMFRQRDSISVDNFDVLRG